MCFGNLKGEDPSNRLDPHLNYRPIESKQQPTSSKMPKREEYTPPPGPPPSHIYTTPAFSSNNPFAGQANEYTPPSGPPPSHSEYTAPSGPPPSHNEFSPPPGSPPSHSEYQAPPGPPPTQQPYHDWQTAVPDTSLLPPPPSLGNQRSSANNATEQQAEQGEAWCQANPLTSPISLPTEALTAIQRGEIGVMKPRSYQGSLDPLRPGVWVGKTRASCPDSCISSSLPLYSVDAHSPLLTEISKTIYYEVRIDKKNRREVSLAMGFGAPPYPTFRLPGWHRGCLAVHGDDGSKYINDRWGGKDFTSVFQPGETLGIGMTFSRRDLDAPPAYLDGPAKTTATTPINVEIFFTRDGRKTGGWNLHEEGDAEEDLPVTGLEGLNDLFATIGVFDSVQFELVFNEGEWMYHP